MTNAQLAGRYELEAPPPPEVYCGAFAGLAETSREGRPLRAATRLSREAELMMGDLHDIARDLGTTRRTAATRSSHALATRGFFNGNSSVVPHATPDRRLDLTALPVVRTAYHGRDATPPASEKSGPPPFYDSSIFDALSSLAGSDAENMEMERAVSVLSAGSAGSLPSTWEMPSRRAQEDPPHAWAWLPNGSLELTGGLILPVGVGVRRPDQLHSASFALDVFKLLYQWRTSTGGMRKALGAEADRLWIGRKILRAWAAWAHRGQARRSRALLQRRIRVTVWNLDRQKLDISMSPLATVGALRVALEHRLGKGRALDPDAVLTFNGRVLYENAPLVAMGIVNHSTVNVEYRTIRVATAANPFAAGEVALADPLLDRAYFQYVQRDIRALAYASSDVTGLLV